MSNSGRGGRGRQTPAGDDSYQGAPQSGSQSQPQSGQSESPYGHAGSPDRPAESWNRQPETQVRQPTTQYSQPATGYSQPTTQYSQPAAGYTQPTTQHSQPATGYSRPATATEYRQPAAATATATRQPEPRYREPEPPRKRPLWHHALLGILGLIAIGGIIALLVVNSGGPSRLARPRPAAGARIGSSFLTKDALGNTYRVRLDRLIDPATGVNTTPAAGSRLVGAVYTITGVSGSPQGENVITNASLLSTSGHIYRAFAGRVAGYGNFSNGTVRVSPGTSETGAATYQIPNGVRLAQAQWAAAAGHGVISRWTLP